MPGYGRPTYATFRALPTWPYPETFPRRSKYVFKATLGNTMNLLRNEIAMLGGGAILIGTGHRQNDIRNDGYPRSDARMPAHPGVEVSFNAEIAGREQRLTYATDVCESWEGNLRSIALGLQALRAVDRYGITRRGEQYAGFAALTAGGPDAEKGRRLVDKHGGVREALFATHPDHGGNDRDFADVQEYRKAYGDDVLTTADGTQGMRRGVR